jgi:hypothetical protein
MDGERHRKTTDDSVTKILRERQRQRETGKAAGREREADRRSKTDAKIETERKEDNSYLH